MADTPLEWITAHPDLESRLRSDPPVRTAVLGCGAGEDAVALALAFPKLTLYGVDPDADAVAAARLGAAERHLVDRTVFVAGDPWTTTFTGSFDLVVACEVAELPPARRPLILRRLATMLGGEGSVLVALSEADVETAAPSAGFSEVERLDHTTAGMPVWRLRQ